MAPPRAKTAFTLTVTKDGASVMATFESGAARLGRAPENDVVINDALASRVHARIFHEAGRFFVEDLQSTAGTRLNGGRLAARAELKPGDRLAIGQVTVLFTTGVDPASTLDESARPAPSVLDQATTLRPAFTPPPPPPAQGAATGLDASTVLRPAFSPPRPSGTHKAAPAPAATSESFSDVPTVELVNRGLVKPPTPVATSESFSDVPTVELVNRAVLQGPAPAGASAWDGKFEDAATRELLPGEALAKSSAAKDLLAEQPTRSLTEESNRLLAADVARERRALQKTSAGRAQLWWASVPAALKAALAVVLMLTFTAVVWVQQPTAAPTGPRMPDELVPNGDALALSFGAGPGAEVQVAESKAFFFTPFAATRLVGVLHFRAHDCGQNEVHIELNGAPVAFVPADTAQSDVELEHVLPSGLLKVGANNQLTFENVRQGDDDETWRIAGLWVELIPLPELTSQQASTRAQDSIDQATQLYELKKIGAINLFRAWKSYREAWLVLEATADHDAALQQFALTRMRDLRPELDQKCTAILVQYEQEMSRRYPSLKKARKILQGVPAHFGKEHPCLDMSRHLLRQVSEDAK